MKFKDILLYIAFLSIGLLLGNLFYSKHSLTTQIHTKQHAQKSMDAYTSKDSIQPEIKNTDSAQLRDEFLNTSRRTSLVAAVEKAAPSVVSITVIRERMVIDPAMADPFFQFFYGTPQATREQFSSIGSGVVLGTGVVVTNFHVVSSGDGEARRQISVILPDGRSFDAKVLGEDPDNDLAVLQIKGKNLPAAYFPNVADNMIGEWVTAIGNPFGYLMGDHQPSVTAGVISALSRSFSLESGIHYHNMIQTDASINPGNSGGALVNAWGELIGINTFILTGGGQNQGSVGIGFAIPIQKVLRVVEEITRYGYIRKWTTGLYAGAESRREVGISIIEVEAGSPGFKAGIRAGDRIIAVAGKETPTLRDFMEILRKFQVGEKVKVDYVRSGKVRSTFLILEESKTQRARKF